MYKDLLLYIVKNLVTDVENIDIQEKKDDNKVTLILKVAKSDMGRIIGKDGRIIRALREIICAYSMKENIKVFISVEEIC
ncbi:MAG: KH domain-containing protein [Clostridia bacterium]